MKIYKPRIFIPLFIALFWSYACVVIKYEKGSEPPTLDWKFVPMPQIDDDGCCLESEEEDELDLKKGPHVLQFQDFLNRWTSWEIERYDLYDQWGDVIAKIKPNKRGVYRVRGVPKGCYHLRAIGRGFTRYVPSGPSNEGCTPGLKTGGIWT